MTKVVKTSRKAEKSVGTVINQVATKVSTKPDKKRLVVKKPSRVNRNGKLRQALISNVSARVDKAIKRGFPFEAVVLIESLISDRIEAMSARFKGYLEKCDDRLKVFFDAPASFILKKDQKSFSQSTLSQFVNSAGEFKELGKNEEDLKVIEASLKKFILKNNTPAEQETLRNLLFGEKPGQNHTLGDRIMAWRQKRNEVAHQAAKLLHSCTSYEATFEAKMKKANIYAVAGKDLLKDVKNFNTRLTRHLNK